MPNPITLSPSKLNLMEDCRRCFYLSVVRKIDRPSGPMSSIPIKMDSIIKRYFDRYRKLKKPPPILNGKVRGLLPIGMPKTLYAECNNIVLKGLPDEYMQLKDKSIVPFDHKTKSKPPDSIHTSYQLQMDVYSFLLKKNGYKTANRAFLAFYYPEHCEVHSGLDIRCKVIEVRTDSGRVQHLLEKAARILKGKLPAAGKECEYCRWREMKFP